VPTADKGGPESRWPAIFVVAAIVIVLAGVHAAASLVIPIAISFIVTVLTAPLEHRLVRAGWHRIAAFTAVVAVTLVSLAAIYWIVDLSLTAFVADLPSYRAGGVQLLTDVLDFGKMIHVNLTRVVHAGSVVGSAFVEADALTRAFLSSIAGWVVVLVLTAFMLFEALDFPDKARDVFGDGDQYRRVVAFTTDLSGFMIIATLAAALTAAGDLAVLLALGIPSALLWSALAFILSYVPSIGSIIIVIPPTIATLVRFGPGRAVLVFVLMLVVDNVVGVIVVPYLLGRRLSVAPFWGMLALVFWAWLLGPAGAILAIPFMLLAKFLLESSPLTARIAKLLAPLVRTPKQPQINSWRR